MVQVPGATPVTMPVTEPIVAIVVLLLDHRPPGMAAVSVIVWPTHTWLPVVGPDIGPGNGFTTTFTLPDIVAVQPVTVMVATTV